MRRPQAVTSMLRVPKACGKCSECCVSLEIEGDGWSPRAPKPAGRACPDLVPLGRARQRAGGGCGVYGERPAVCARFRCLWLMVPDLPDDWRPDRTGLLLDVQEVSVRGRATLALAIEETHYGAISGLRDRQCDTLTVLSRHPDEWGLGSRAWHIAEGRYGYLESGEQVRQMAAAIDTVCLNIHGKSGSLMIPLRGFDARVMRDNYAALRAAQGLK